MLDAFQGASSVDIVVFVLAAAGSLAGAIGVVVSRNPVHSALSLVGTLFGVAVLFVAQQAHFLAAVQVIVYAGAVVVLFLFVIMLLGVDREEDLSRDPLRGQRTAAVVVGAVGLLLVLVLQLGSAFEITGGTAAAGSASEGGNNVELIANSLFSRYLLAFEVTSVLLVIAVIGAVVLARKHRYEKQADSRSVTQEDAAA